MGFFGNLFGDGVRVEIMAEHLAKVEHGSLLNSQQKKKCVQLIKNAQGGTIDRSKLKVTMERLQIEGLWGIGVKKHVIQNNMHLVTESSERILKGIDKEIREEIGFAKPLNRE